MTLEFQGQDIEVSPPQLSAINKFLESLGYNEEEKVESAEDIFKEVFGSPL